MRFMHILTLIVVLLGGSLLDAAAVQIALEDGSVVSGDVVSLENGVYTVRTGSLGTVRIPSSQIRSIVNTGPQQNTSADEENRVYHPRF